MRKLESELAVERSILQSFIYLLNHRYAAFIAVFLTFVIGVAVQPWRSLWCLDFFPFRSDQFGLLTLYTTKQASAAWYQLPWSLSQDRLPVRGCCSRFMPRHQTASLSFQTLSNWRECGSDTSNSTACFFVSVGFWATSAQSRAAEVLVTRTNNSLPG